MLKTKSRRAVYKFQHTGQIYYRLGNSLANARGNLARELGTSPARIEIMEKGEPQ